MGTTALAQDSGIPQSIISSANTLTEEQKGRIRSFVDAQIALLAGKDPEKASRARADLASLPVRPGASEVFQREYAAIVRPGLEPILTGPDAQQAVNAIIITQALRTPESIDVLLRFADPEQEKRLPVRLRAVSSLAEAVPAAALTPVQIDGIVRRILALGMRESNWVAQHHAFRALARIASMPKLPDPSVDAAIRAQAELVDSIIERIGKNVATAEIVGSLANNLLVARDQLTGTTRADHARALRTRLSGALIRFLELTDREWDDIRGASPEIQRYFASAVNVAGVLLQVAARSDAQQPLDVNFAGHWDAGDHAAFTADLKKAQQVLGKRPGG